MANSNCISREHFTATVSRSERYRYAGRTLRFSLYRWMELYFVVSVAAACLLPWLGDGFLTEIAAYNVWLVALVGVLHNLRLFLEKPWVACGSAFEALVVWAIYHWIVSSFVSIPFVNQFCVFLFVYRYWDRGEDDVNVRAFDKFTELCETNPDH